MRVVWMCSAGLLLVAGLASGCGGPDASDPLPDAPLPSGPRAAVDERPADEPDETPERALSEAATASRSASCAAASVTPERSVRREDEVVYAELGGRPMHLDLVRPEGAGPHPVVLLFHGGAFRRGDEDYMHGVAGRLARLGYASAAVEYRHIGTDEADFPAGVADARCAVRYLRREAERLDLDPDRVVALGFSAGGYFAASLATQADDPALDGDCPLEGDASVRGAVAYFAPLDLRAEAAWSPTISALFENVLGRDPAEDPELARRASPAVDADGDDAPLLIVAGTDDAIVPIDQARAAAAEMRRAGARVELIEAPGAHHGFGFASDDAPPEATCGTVAFLARICGKAS